MVSMPRGRSNERYVFQQRRADAIPAMIWRRKWIIERRNNTTDLGVEGIHGRFLPMATSTTSATSWTPNADTYDQEAQTARAGEVTINAPSGTPSDGKKLILRIKCGGTGRNITWNGVYVPMGVTLPTTISASKTIYAGCDYNSNTSKWDVLAVATEP